jgi:4-hydroxy-tetrahydrodipicolinate synthase
MRGIYTALVTPFTSRGELDLAAYKRILDDQVAAGVAGVVPCGTTGETPTLSTDEKKTLIQTAIAALKGTGVKVMAGTGGNSTAETIEMSRWASDAGADALLIVTPYYNKPSQAGLEAHFRAVADTVKCEIMLYNVPGRTGVSLMAETIVNLAKHPRITALKEATGNVAFSSEILDQLDAAGEKLDILSGDDATFLPMLSAGCVGVVSVSSNLFPRAMVAIQKHLEAGNIAEAQKVHRRFYPLFRDLFIDSNPVPIKHAMGLAGFCDAGLRAPLVRMNATHTAKLEASLRRCGIEKGSRL